jgi:hypothetical protein
MGITKGVFSLTCSKCNKQYDFDGASIEFDHPLGFKRQEGTENGYIWEHFFACDCENEITVDYEVWEYPAGTLENDDVRIVGGAEIKRYEYDFSPEAKGFKEVQED